MDISFNQEIFYSNKEHLLLSEVAEALLAAEKSASAAPDVIEALFNGVKVHDFRVYVDELHSGSLTEKLKYYLKLVIQKHIEDKTGVELGDLESAPDEKKKQIIAWAIAAATVMALKVAADRYLPNQDSTNINQQVNVTIEQGHMITGIDNEVLRSAIENSISENPSAVAGAVEFVKPAKKDSDARIDIDGQSYLSSAAIAEVPNELPENELQEKSLELEDTEIQIRATDKDSGKRGWGATIPEFSEKRMRISIAPGIDLVHLAHFDQIVGNVTIFYSIDEHGTVTNIRAHLFSVDLEATDELAGDNAL